VVPEEPYPLFAALATNVGNPIIPLKAEGVDRFEVCVQADIEVPGNRDEL